MDKDFLEQYEKLRKEYFDFVEENGKKIIKFKIEQLKEIFKDYDLEEIKWDQYTPYFMDGDPCVFAVHDFLVKFKGDDNGGDYEDGYYTIWDIRDQDNFKNNRNLLNDLDNFVFNNDEDDLFLQAFGDHVMVTYDINKDIFKVKEIEHD